MLSSFTKQVVYPPVYALESDIRPTESLEEKIIRIATEYNISTTTLYNLVKGESNFNHLADNGKDRGLVQINREHNPEITDEQAFDPDFSLRFASEKISKSEEYLWTVCNCYSYAQAIVDYELPKMFDIVPNSNYPRVGGLVVLRYKNNKHIAVVKSVSHDGIIIKEANFEPCLVGERLIKWDDPALKGFVDYRE